MEIIEAVERSLVRGRTIELFHETVSEGGTFKAIMAASGCFLLILTFLGFFFSAIVAGLKLPVSKATYWKFWPILLIVIFAIFLLLQLLKPSTTKPTSPSTLAKS